MLNGDWGVGTQQKSRPVFRAAFLCSAFSANQRVVAGSGRTVFAFQLKRPIDLRTHDIDVVVIRPRNRSR